MERLQPIQTFKQNMDQEMMVWNRLHKQQLWAPADLSYGAKADGSPVIQFDGVTRPYSAVGVKNNVNNFYRPSVDFVNTIALSGGTNAFNFRASASYLKSDAQTPNSTFERKTSNLALRSNLGKNNLITLEANVQYNIENAKNRPGVGYAEINSSWATYLLGSTVDISGHSILL